MMKGAELMKTYHFPPTVAMYNLMHSSGNKRYMAKWNTPDYDEASQRWFQIWGRRCSGWQDLEYAQEQDFADLDTAFRKNPKISCRKSFYEMAYGKQPGSVARMWLCLSEYVNGQKRTWDIELKEVSKDKLIAVEQAVWRWHRTGEVDAKVFGSEPDWRN